MVVHLNIPQVLRFPSSFDPHERAHIVEEATKLGLIARESGRNENKHVSVTRPVEYTECDKENLRLRDTSQNLIHTLLRDLPVKQTELSDLQVIKHDTKNHGRQLFISGPEI